MAAQTEFSFRAWSNILPTKPPEATIEGILLRGRFGVIFAQPDNGKTFAAIAAALSVGTGWLFGDRAVRKGWSIFIAAEAAYDLEVRVPAWRKLHPDAGEPLGGCYGQAVNFYNELEVSLFLGDLQKQLNGEHLELLVIDTLTASMVGGNQDWSKDMTIFINNVKMVMAATGCAVLVVHHAGWNETSREKGSIDLRGAADVVIETSLEEEQADGGRIITLTCRKTKSLRPFQPFSMALVPVTIKTPEGDFESLALGDPVATPAKVGKADKTSKSKDQLDDMLDVLSTLVRATYKDWMAAMQEFGRGYSETSFNRKLAELRKQGRVTGGGAQGEYYSVVPSGPSGASASVGPGAAVQPDEMQPEHPIPTTPAKPLPPLPPLKGGGSGGSAFGTPKPQPNHSHGGGGSGSSEGRAEEGSVAKPAYRRGADGFPVCPGHPEYTPEGDPDLVADAFKHMKTKPPKV